MREKKSLRDKILINKKGTSLSKNSLSQKSTLKKTYSSIARFALFTLLLSSLLTLYLSSCAQQKENLIPENIIPPKIVIGGESSGKIALIKKQDGTKQQTFINEVNGAVFHQVMFSHDGKYIFAAASNLNKVYVFDGESLSLIKEIDVGEYPSHMHIDDEGKILAVTNEDSNDISFISVEKLEEVKRIKGFSTPHFARYYNGLWFVANLTANKISVVDIEKGIVKEIEVKGVPECAEHEECAFFDVSVRGGTGLASHIKSGKIIEFNPKTLEIVNEVSKENNHLLAKAYEGLKEINAFRTTISPFDPAAYTVFSKGVVIYDYVARSVFGVLNTDEEFFSQFAIEYPGKVFVLMHDKNKILIASKFKIEKIVDIDGTPGEGIYHNGYIYLFSDKGNTTSIWAMNGEGEKYKIAEIEFDTPEGIHIPGAYPYCH
jgi:hypothetical protein